jgi:hypothetical protein
MTPWKLVITGVLFSALSQSVSANHASTASITITGQQAGVTPFIVHLNLTVGNPSVLKNIQFAIRPKAGSVTRALSATYLASYLESRGYLNLQTGVITLPIFGLYAGYANHVILTYSFTDGSSKSTSVLVTTANFADTCGFSNPMVLQPRTQDTDLSYDYMLVKSDCSPNSPTIIDTDGAIRSVAAAGLASLHSAFFDNAIYLAQGAQVFRFDLDGRVRLMAVNYNDIGITDFNHNIDYGKSGLILDADTKSYLECVNIEVDKDSRSPKKVEPCENH